GKVRLFAGVVGEVEQLGRLAARHDQLPRPGPDRAAVQLGVDEDDIVGRRLALRDRRPHVLAVDGVFLLRLRAGELEQRGIPVDHVQRLVDDGARLDLSWPRHPCGYADAALVESALAGAKTDVRRGLLDRSAVVAAEDEERIVEYAALFESCLDAADGV